MSGGCCPCGTRLDRSTAARSVRSPFFRMFISIRSMKPLAHATKVCNICRHSYKKWRRENSEYDSVIDYMENGQSEVEEDDTDPVRTRIRPLRSIIEFLCRRLMRWMESPVQQTTIWCSHHHRSPKLSPCKSTRLALPMSERKSVLSLKNTLEVVLVRVVCANALSMQTQSLFLQSIGVSCF